jgi:hypothetical protein
MWCDGEVDVLIDCVLTFIRERKYFFLLEASGNVFFCCWKRAEMTRTVGAGGLLRHGRRSGGPHHFPHWLLGWLRLHDLPPVHLAY